MTCTTHHHACACREAEFEAMKRAYAAAVECALAEIEEEWA